MSTTEKPKLCVDIDNVLGKTDAVMREIIRVATVSKDLPEGIRYQYQDITDFAYSNCRNQNKLAVSKAVWEAVHEIFQDPKSGYVDLIQPMDGALAGLQALRERWDIWIVTARHDGGLRKAMAWVDRHFPGFSHNVHSSYKKKKWDVAKFAASVDDHKETAEGFAMQGVRSFVYKHPWNRGLKPIDNQLTVVTGWPELVLELDRCLACLA